MSGSMSYTNIKATSIARDTEEKRRDTREKAMLLFTFHLLLENGYADSATTLATECSLNLDQYVICDNVDMRTIFVDFEAYYHLRFSKYPQYYKKLNSGNGSNRESLLAKLKIQSKGTRSGGKPTYANTSTKISSSSAAKGKSSMLESEDIPNPSIHSANSSPCLPSLCGTQITSPTSEDKLIKPISSVEFFNDDMKNFAQIIQKEIVVKNLDVKWNEVVGKKLDEAKVMLEETFQKGTQFTNFFGHTFFPWQGLLLYGPPGTGKTLLAKATASQISATFFNISSASIVSKWRGDSEKLVKVLFDLARYHQPSIIFMDEFEAIGSNRDTTNETDASKRLKSEILQQIDGILSQSENSNVFILAATNLPWELDPAIVRRLEKRLYIPLPDEAERCALFKLYLTKIAKSIGENSKKKNCLACEIDLEILSMQSSGYSGSDINQIIKESVIQKFHQTHHPQMRCLEITTEDILNVMKEKTPTITPKMITKYTTWNGKK